MIQLTLVQPDTITVYSDDLVINDWDAILERPINKHAGTIGLVIARNATMKKLDGRRRTPDPPEMLKLAAVIKLVGLHRNTIDRLVKQQHFPQPTRPNGTIRQWHKDEVLEWREANRVYTRTRGPRIKPLKQGA